MRSVDGVTVYFPEDSNLARDDVLKLIYDADRILRVVFSLGRLIDEGKIPILSRKI
jgi:hypothetical protein